MKILLARAVLYITVASLAATVLFLTRFELSDRKRQGEETYPPVDDMVLKEADIERDLTNQ